MEGDFKSTDNAGEFDTQKVLPVSGKVNGSFDKPCYPKTCNNIISSNS